MSILAPCKDCEDREVGCHSICEKYLKYKENRNIILEDKVNRHKVYDDYLSVRRQHKKKRKNK